ncbi:MAG: uracil-DNA glycosylase family protein [Acidobacteriota bacterium]
MNRRQREKLRRVFQPAKVGVLFVGESPPASGRFFYNRDSGLYRSMRDVFALIDQTVSDVDFLARFRQSGCYLVDLCPEPVDKMPADLRRSACAAGETSLAGTITRLQPRMIATLVRSIEANVTRAATRAGWNGEFVHLPYPGRWSRHRARFSQLLMPVLKRIG